MSACGETQAQKSMVCFCIGKCTELDAWIYLQMNIGCDINDGDDDDYYCCCRCCGYHNTRQTRPVAVGIGPWHNVLNMDVCACCSAGCGRTGVLCVIDYTWNLLKRQVTPRASFHNIHLISPHTSWQLWTCTFLPVCRRSRQTSASTISSNTCARRGPLWYRLRWHSLFSVFYFLLLEETTV